MLKTSRIPARNLQKSYKTIIDGVRIKKQAVVLTTKNQPQAAIISLEDFEKLKVFKNTQAALDMLKLVKKSREELKSLPSDLRERANDILYGKQD